MQKPIDPKCGDRVSVEVSYIWVSALSRIAVIGDTCFVPLMVNAGRLRPFRTGSFAICFHSEKQAVTFLTNSIPVFPEDALEGTPTIPGMESDK